MSKGKIDGVQIGRGLAALAVVVAHAFAHPLPEAPHVSWLLGRFGVTLFFVISGFIMVFVTGAERFDPVRFIRHRVLRIAPMYYLATLFVVIVSLVAPSVFKNTVFSIPHIVKSLLFIPAYRPANGAIEPFFKLGWTLNYEMYFYVCFALLFALKSTARAVILTSFFLLSVAVGRLMHFDSAILTFYTGYDVIGFAAGMWVAEWWRRQATTTRLRTPGGLSALFGLAVVATIVAFTMDAGKAPRVDRQLLMVLSSVALVTAFSLIASVGSSKAAHVAKYIGDASYSIYLTHMFAVGFAGAIFHKFFSAAGVTGYLAASLFGLIAGIVGGCLCYAFVEKPLGKLVHRATGGLKARASTPGPNAAAAVVDR